MKRFEIRPGAMVPFVALALATFSKDARAGAFERVVRELAQALGDVPPGAQVVAAPLTTDLATPRADELSVRLAALLAGRVGKGAKPVEKPLALAAAQGHAKGAPALVFLTPSIEKGQLRVGVDLYAVPKNGWERIRTPVPAPKSHGFGSASLDAEVRTFFPAVALEQAAILKAKIDDDGVLAAACGDLDGDGGLEIALVSRAKVSLGRFAKGVFKVERSMRWTGLAPRAPTPLRDPIATASFADDRLLVGITDRGGVALDAELSPISKLRGLPLSAVGVEACAAPVPEASALEGAVACSPVGSAGAKMPLPAPRFDAVATTVVTARTGTENAVIAAREPTGRIRIRFGGSEVEGRSVEGGPEVAIYDLDLDGTPELATSLEAEDAFVIYSIARGAEPKLRRKIATTAPVRALAACPPEARGVPGLVAVVGSEVWLVR